MKIVETNKNKKERVKKKPIEKTKKEHVFIVAQEIKFARLLSGNEKKTRDRVLKSLKKWLLNCYQRDYAFKEDDFIRVWKGLFYAVWMSDKPLVQEELCESIASVLDTFPPEQIKYALLMTKAGLKVLATEWYGIDQHRIDKFLMLVRRYMRGSLRCLRRCEWSLESCKMYADMLSGADGLFALKTPHYARNAQSLVIHFIDCFLEELAKVSEGKIPPASLVELLRPFCGYMCGGEAPVVCICARRLLTALMRQSDLGLQYSDATRAWQKMGCPEGGPDALELVVEDDDDENEQQNGDAASDDEQASTEKPLDPRAGRVDVVLATLPVPAEMIASMLRGMLARTSSKAYKRVHICMKRFEQLAKNEYPLRIKEEETIIDNGPRLNPRKSISSLLALDQQLVAGSDELALRGLSRKHRKRLLAKSRSGLSIVEDVEKFKGSPTKTANGEWQVESTEPQEKKQKLNTSDKENQHKNKKAKKLKLNKRADEKTEQTKKRKQEKNEKLNGEVTKKLKVEKPKKVKLTEKDDVKINIVKNTTVLKDKTKKTNSEKPNKKMNNDKPSKKIGKSETKNPSLVVNKVKNFQKQVTRDKEMEKKVFGTPKKVKFVLKKNSMQGTVDYYNSIRQSPSIPFDGDKKPSKTNLKPSMPSPINPFFKKKLRMKH